MRYLVLIVLVAFVGCRPFGIGREEPASATHREALREALEAWKNRRLDALAGRSPPIRLDDEDQQAGMTLLDFEIQSPPPGLTPPGVAVRLRLRDARRRPVLRHASYRIESAAEIVVRRDDS